MLYISFTSFDNEMREFISSIMSSNMVSEDSTLFALWFLFSPRSWIFFVVLAFFFPWFAMDDPVNPLYLHHSDNPGLVLVSQLLTGENYNSWSLALSIALSMKNKLGFINWAAFLKPAHGGKVSPSLFQNVSDFCTFIVSAATLWQYQIGTFVK